MKKLIYISICLTSFIILALAMQSLAFTLSRDDATYMMQQCENIRAEKIAPIQQQEIKDCIAKGQTPPDGERDNQTFGETRHVNGKVMPGLFWQTAVCQQALKGWKILQGKPQ